MVIIRLINLHLLIIIQFIFIYLLFRGKATISHSFLVILSFFVVLLAGATITLGVLYSLSAHTIEEIKVFKITTGLCHLPFPFLPSSLPPPFPFPSPPLPFLSPGPSFSSSFLFYHTFSIISVYLNSLFVFLFNSFFYLLFPIFVFSIFISLHKTSDDCNVSFYISFDYFIFNFNVIFYLF